MGKYPEITIGVVFGSPGKMIACLSEKEIRSIVEGTPDEASLLEEAMYQKAIQTKKRQQERLRAKELIADVRLFIIGFLRQQALFHAEEHLKEWIARQPEFDELTERYSVVGKETKYIKYSDRGSIFQQILWSIVYNKEYIKKKKEWDEHDQEVNDLNDWYKLCNLICDIDYKWRNECVGQGIRIEFITVPDRKKPTTFISWLMTAGFIDSICQNLVLERIKEKYNL